MLRAEDKDIHRIVDVKFDMHRLLEAYEIATERIGFQEGIVNCISVTHTASGRSDPRGIFWMRDDNYNEIQLERPVSESKYTKIEPRLAGTYFEDIVRQLSERFTIGRVRILKLDSRTSLSFHRDPESRIHIPIITNPGALVIVENYATHIPADGSVYIMNTKKYHTALNGGNKPRIHLVASIVTPATPDEDELYAVYGGD